MRYFLGPVDYIVVFVIGSLPVRMWGFGKLQLAVLVPVRPKPVPITFNDISVPTDDAIRGSYLVQRKIAPYKLLYYFHDCESTRVPCGSEDVEFFHGSIFR